ncbi:MAG: 4Fe-4S ferredoxin, partial [Deltaproteobacteria bacterium]|nr:4Fe-4S ferredoxin [Deltaproteobacteria bacterium]
TFHKTLNRDKPVSYKCDNCLDRQKDGREPACVEVCKTGALVFGEINEIIGKSKQDIVIKITKDIKGIVPSELPENISMFNSIREKIAQLGPMASSK